MINPGLFLLNVAFKVLSFNFTGAFWLLGQEGVQACVTLYLISSVYSLYLEMGQKPEVQHSEEAGRYSNNRK